MSHSVIIHVVDSFEHLSKLAEAGERVDVIITDPPYPEKVQANMCSGSLVGVKSVPKYELDFAPLDANRKRFLDATLAMTRRWLIAFCGVEDFGRFQDARPAEYVRSAIWYKSNAMGQLTADRPAAAYEGVAILHRSDEKKRWNGKGSYGIWRCNGTRGKKGRHPNEKPMDLCLKLVALFSERGETVLDPFCGSGAIGEACIRLGRNYIGFDCNREWAQSARARLLQCSASMTEAEALALCSMRGGDPAADAGAT